MDYNDLVERLRVSDDTHPLSVYGQLMKRAADAIEALVKERDEARHVISGLAQLRDAAIACAEKAEAERDEVITLAKNAENQRVEVALLLAEAREALEPFANMSSEVSQNWREHETHWPQCVEFEHPATVGDLRRARQLLVKIKAVTS